MSTDLFQSLNPSLSSALTAMGFDQPTPIQAASIPVALANNDLIGCAQTGTGKTGAFCIPAIEKLLANPNSNALILCPTRELALQVERVWRDLIQNARHLRACLVIGGEPMYKQVKALRMNPRCVVATPGRLVDHLNRQNTELADFDFLVLDEADRMLDMGFRPQLAQVLSFMPAKKQVLLFTATWNKNLQNALGSHLKNPKLVSTGPMSQPTENIEQLLVGSAAVDKAKTLIEVLQQHPGQSIVFARTKIRVERLCRSLSQSGFEVAHIHGDRTQGQRKQAIRSLRENLVQVLVATDVAARGLDIPSIDCVINVDLPEQAEDYIHRIGRTARAGRSGKAISLVSSEDRHLWRNIEHTLRGSKSKVPAWPQQAMAKKASPGSAPERSAETSDSSSERSEQRPAQQQRSHGQRSFGRSQQRQSFSNRFSGPSRGFGNRRRPDSQPRSER